MALAEGVKYGLSSQANHGNKTVIFVKLTDSALRAVDDYLKAQHKSGHRATLRFLGNEGNIHIPAGGSENGHSFDFNLSTNTDIESPQGSFECIQQCGARALESAGPLSYKMRIKANDDVFVQTQHRFTELEHERRQERAKEIESGCVEIGRKVKNKFSKPPLPQRSAKSPNYVSQHQQPKYPSSASNFANASNNSHKLPNGYNSSSSSNNKKIANGTSNGNGCTALVNGIAPKPGPGANPTTQDITRRPLKERLIHMLAVKPYKKPELFQRLISDGMKDRDRKVFMTILQQIASFKDNEYSLLRGVWNDVQEDWPFFSEQEKQLMKRRKPQNLTPPGSDSSVGSGTSSLSPRSNSSTGSGHSPSNFSHSSNYHHKPSLGTTGSIDASLKGLPPVEEGQETSKGIKRAVPNAVLPENSEDYGDIPSKKTRVSHFKKPGSGSHSNTNGANTNLISRCEITFKHDKDGSSGSSPQFLSHNNRIAERLSPIGTNGGNFSNGGNGANLTNHRSPRNGNFESMDVSPSHNSVSNNGCHNSSQKDVLIDESVSVGSTWQSRHGNDVQGLSDSEKIGRGDSDETDSVDSGNGSSGSGMSLGSLRHQNFNNHGSVKDVHGNHSNGPTFKASDKSEPISSSVYNNANNSSFINGCNRVSSTTNFQTTPQSSPDSQVDAMQLQQQKCQQTNNNVSTLPSIHVQRANGKCNYEVNPHLEIVSRRDKGGEWDPHRDRENSRRNDRNKEKEREARNKERLKRSSEKKHKKNSDDRVDRDGHVLEIDHAGSPMTISEYPSYLTKYTSITNSEDRCKYKEDFNVEYAVYLDLHAVIDKVSKRFAHLEERLRQEERGTEGYEKIKDQIVNEYYANKRDKKYQETRQKFQYLHEKLSHIKRLITDYDAHHNHDEDLSNEYINGFLRN